MLIWGKGRGKIALIKTKKYFENPHLIALAAEVKKFVSTDFAHPSKPKPGHQGFTFLDAKKGQVDMAKPLPKGRAKW